ncbi:hypothetical protein [Deinococcus pimensis]|uniref:hypothetical protein n=1 Tax=Deinococcus pimensis TaxID=309888 RepID=UPI0004B3E605|nr:hypothetical protein [Deinococcus pimensis]
MLPRIDKKVVVVTTQAEVQDDDLDFWLSQPVEARLAAGEVLRRMSYPNGTTPRLQRVLEITTGPRH